MVQALIDHLSHTHTHTEPSSLLHHKSVFRATWPTRSRRCISVCHCHLRIYSDSGSFGNPVIIMLARSLFSRRAAFGVLACRNNTDSPASLFSENVFCNNSAVRNEPLPAQVFLQQRPRGDRCRRAPLGQEVLCLNPRVPLIGMAISIWTGGAA